MFDGLLCAFVTDDQRYVTFAVAGDVIGLKQHRAAKLIAVSGLDEHISRHAVHPDVTPSDQVPVVSLELAATAEKRYPDSFILHISRL